MIPLRIRTEYSFGRAFGRLPKIVDRLHALGASAAGIADDGTWGHVPWVKTLKAAGIRPLLGAEVLVVKDARDRSKQYGGERATILARNADGLRELYTALSRAHSAECYYYVPRLDYRDLNAITSNCYTLHGPGADLSRLDRPADRATLLLLPGATAWNATARRQARWPLVAQPDNYFPLATDRTAYELACFRNVQRRLAPMHLLDEWELRDALPEATDADFARSEAIAADCVVALPRAEMVKYPWPKTLWVLCEEGAVARQLDLGATAYATRLAYELDLIARKNFTDYFQVIADLVAFAKTVMIVGPARGSSAGSLVCFLLGITDVDPLVHDLMFERFIDITREDLPDIDIDFQDDKRDRVALYLREKYGADRVGQIGTVLRFKVDSALGIVGKAIAIQKGEMDDLKGAIIKRSSGDARAQFCIADAFAELEVGRALLAKYPGLALAGELEGAAQYSGKHAAGLLVTNTRITDFATIGHNGTAQIDKKDAEALNMLKIDALGLRTLSVLDDCLAAIGKDRAWLVTYPLDDAEAFELFNREMWAGIFQYEGYALQSLCRQMKVTRFDDVAVITALARPGPLHCGAAADFIACRTGARDPEPMHPRIEHLTRSTYGVVIYQEQVVGISREMGQLSWEQTAELRKAMSKSLGDEFFNGYWNVFRDGAAAQGIAEGDARRVWDKICTFGSWAFNKSHAVSYGLVSYWCAVLKAHYPLEFAAATLRNAKSEEQAIQILRELSLEGYRYKPVDATRSLATWSVVDGELLGGLTNIVGIGVKKAEQILEARASGKKLPPSLRMKLLNPITPYDHVFEARERFADMYAHPTAYNILSGPISTITEIQEPGDYVFIGKLRQKKLRDLNEVQSVAKRGGRRIAEHTLFLNLVLEDDSGQIIARISRYDYAKLGKPIIETAKLGDYFLWKGRLRGDGWRIVEISTWRKLPCKRVASPVPDSSNAMR